LSKQGLLSPLHLTNHSPDGGEKAGLRARFFIGGRYEADTVDNNQNCRRDSGAAPQNNPVPLRLRGESGSFHFFPYSRLCFEY
jgi:hypothetical protein